MDAGDTFFWAKTTSKTATSPRQIGNGCPWVILRAPTEGFHLAPREDAPETVHVMERLMKPQVLDQCLLTLEGHASADTSCASSGDSTRIVAASWDTAARL